MLDPGTAALQFRLLGSTEVARGGRLLPVGGPRQRSVLALLVLNVNQVVPVDRLIADLWMGDPPPRALETLRVYVSRLREQLEPQGPPFRCLLTRRPGYELRVPVSQVDVLRFESLVEEGRRAQDSGDPDAASRTFREALRLWRGPALADLLYEPFAQEEARRLEDLRLAAVEASAAAELELGRHQELVPELGPLARAHPFRERLWELLMLALYRSGRQAAALETFREARRTLRDELGIDPGPALQRMEASILIQDPSLEPAPPEPRQNLPVRLTSFVGRAWELKRFRHLLEEASLITITGAPGAGKTRLALEGCSGLARRYPGGMWWVDLAPLTRPDQVPEAIALAIGVREERGRPLLDAVAARLGARASLVLLDNCEHLAASGAETAWRLLTRCPSVQIVATSREPLGVTGERVFPLPPLGLPEPAGPARAGLDSDAVRLLIERARDRNPDLGVDETEAEVAGRVVRRLDGLPLAIELAAGRMAGLSLRQLAERLDDRFHLLSRDWPGDLTRHRSLAAALDWSYELLSEPERMLLLRASVFVGTFSLEAAEAVCSAPPLRASAIADLLGRLVDRSLIVVEGTAAHRYRLLESIRRYAAARRERPDEGALRLRHLDFFRRVAEEAEPHLRGPDLASWLERLDAERENLRAALQHAEDAADVNRALGLTAALARYWWKRSQATEGLHWMRAALALDGDSGSAGSRDRVRTLIGAALVGAEVDHPDSAAWAEAAVPLAEELGEARWEAWALTALSLALVAGGDLSRAGRLGARARPLFEQAADGEGLASAYAVQGLAAKYAGQYEVAERSFERALQGYREIGDGWDAAWAAGNLGDLAMFRGDYERAASLNAEALRAFRALDDVRGTASELAALGRASIAMGQVERARVYFEEGLAMARDGDYGREIVRCLDGLATVEHRQGAPDRATRLFAAYGHLAARMGIPETPQQRSHDRGEMDALRAALGPERFDRCWNDGLGLSMERAVALALGRGAEAADQP